jgi:hypothetical protein
MMRRRSRESESTPAPRDNLPNWLGHTYGTCTYQKCATAAQREVSAVVEEAVLPQYRSSVRHSCASPIMRGTRASSDGATLSRETAEHTLGVERLADQQDRPDH